MFDLNQFQLPALSFDELIRLKSDLVALKPWVKGPFHLYDFSIEGEWDSGLKWERLSEVIDGLVRGKDVMDVGCNNGYFMFRMLANNPKSVLGVDPVDRVSRQFSILHDLLNLKTIEFRRIGVDDLLESYYDGFDSVFLMGILYHIRDYAWLLDKMKRLLRAEGALILESLVIDVPGEELIVPKRRYHGMRNVFHLPSIGLLDRWVKAAGFREFEVLDISVTAEAEQRVTEWGRPVSLSDFLDPEDPRLTIEGYPRPTRVMALCR